MNSFVDEMKEYAEGLAEDMVRKMLDDYYHYEIKPQIIEEVKKGISLQMFEKLGRMGFEIEFVPKKRQ